jgi:hypothetical protein
VQNYGNWSPEITPPNLTCLGVEYFCNMSDAIWKAADAPSNTSCPRTSPSCTISRFANADGLATVREFLAKVPNLQLVGRNGMHRYNNQDHSMLTAILAARDVVGARFDLWNLSVDKDCLEAGPQISNEELSALGQSQPLLPKAI